MYREAEYTKGWFGLALFSDIHLGATDIQEQRLKVSKVRKYHELYAYIGGLDG